MNDNYVYGSQGQNLIRISSNGTVQIVRNLGFGSNSADMDRNNNLYMRRTDNQFTRVNVVTGATTNLNFSGPTTGSAADMVFVQSGTQRYLIGFGGTTMVRYNIGALTKSVIAVSGLPSDSYGASWIDRSGRLFTFNNTTGRIYEISNYLTGTPSATLVAQGVPSGNNDGFSCPLNYFPNLAPLAFDDDYTTMVNVGVTDNVIEDNGNGQDNDPEGTTLTVTTTPVSGPSHGTVVLQANGDFTYTPDTNFIGTDTFVYQITDGSGLTATATVTIVIDGTIDYTLDKTQVSGPSPATDAGSVLGYEVVLVNTGDVALTNVSVQDTLPDGTIVSLTGPTETGATGTNVTGQLDIGETWTFTYSYTVTQDDIDDGSSLVNAIATTTDETTGTKTDSVTTPVTRTPSFTLTKVVDETAITAPGLLTYTITVANTGNVTLTSPTLDDTLAQSGSTLTFTSAPALSGDANTDGNLDVGETWVFSATYDVPQSAIDDGGDIVNTATFSVTEAASQTQAATTTISRTPAMTVTKTVDTASLSAPGLLSYEITIANTGNVTLTGVNVTDTLTQGTATLALTSGMTLSGDTDNDGEIDVGETWIYVGTYQATQANIDDGATITNTVLVETNELADETRTADTTITQTKSFTLDKTVDTASLSAPGLLSYEITIANTGNVTLTGVTVTDTLTQGTATLALTSGMTLSGDTDNDGEIDVGETWTYVGTYQATQDNIDDGATITNTVLVETNELADETRTADTTITQTKSFTLDKTVDTASLSAPGLLSYEITIANTGNVTLTGVNVTDTLTQGTATLALTSGLGLYGDTDNDGEIDVGETWIYVGTYQATQANIDDGADIGNSVTVSTTEAGSLTDAVTTTITQSPSFALTKEVNKTSLSAPGTLTYTVRVENTGNLTLTGISLGDVITQGAATLTPTTGPTLSGDVDSDTLLDVNETWIYTLTLAVPQSGIDDGNDIVNTATFTTAEAGSDTASATTTIAQNDLLTLTKAVASGQPTSFDAVGDTIDFTFTVTNSGNTTRPGPITIDDDQIGAGLACSTGDLLPGASVSCTVTWTAVQADLDAGSVTNTATAKDGSGLTSAPKTATVTAVQNADLAISKSIVAPVPANFQAGETLYYSYVVTNPGNVTLAVSAISVTDNLVPSLSCTPPASGELPPLGSGTADATNSITCTGSYVIGVSDVDIGSVTNLATAATTYNGTPIEATDSAVFPVGAAPVLTLDKTTATTSVSSTSDTITYSYAVTNTKATPTAVGVAIVEPIYIDDDKLPAPFLCYDPSVSGQLAVGATATCTAPYAVTQADLDNGEVTNVAVATSSYANGSGSPVSLVSATDTVTVPVDASPAVSLAKSVTSGAGPSSVGQTVSYQLVAENTGNQTLSNVTISDPMLGTLSCTPLATPVSLAPGATLTCTGSYVVTQADIDGQTVGSAPTSALLTNTATVAANDPDGVAVTPATDTVTHPLVAAAPAVSIVKQLYPNPSADPAFTNVGDLVRFRMSVTNSGNMTLTDVSVTDSLVSGTCSVGALAPGESDNSCIFTYTATQADLDNHGFTNTATVSGQPADTSAPRVEDTDSLAVPGPAFAAELEVIKSGSLDLGADGAASVGDVISYTITVTNTGNVTVSNIAVTDPNATGITYAAADDADSDNDIDALAPTESATVTAVHYLTQADIDAGTVSNTATATGSDPDSSPVSDLSDSDKTADGTGPDDPTRVSVPRTPALTVSKTASATTNVAVGTTITYTYQVENTGNVTLTNVTLTDTHHSAAGTSYLAISPGGGVIATMEPGDTATLSATYVVTQADINAGTDLTNTVRATSSSPSGTTPPTATDTETVDLADAAPSIEVIKTLSSQTGVAPGDTVVFEITVENTGNVDLNTVTLTDTMTRADTTPVSPSPIPVWDGSDSGTAGVLDVGETWTYSFTYELVQADIDGGGLVNSVLGEAKAPDGSPVSDLSDNGTGTGDTPTTVPITASPAIEVLKTITSTDVDAGDTVTFELTVKNTGNVTLTGVTFTDETLTRKDAGGTVLALGSGPTFSSSSGGSAAGTLKVNETATYTATYALTQDDVDAGGISNTATAEGTPPSGTPVSDVSDNGTGTGNTPTDLVISASPSITLDKRLAAGSGPTFSTVGETLVFEFAVTNTGNVTVSNITVTDPLPGVSTPYTCTIASIAPGATDTSCTLSVTVQQSDIDAGQIVNTASVEGTTPGGDPVDDDDTETVPGPAAAPAIEATKLVTVPATTLGTVVEYTLLVENVGNTSLSAVSVSDQMTRADGTPITLTTPFVLEESGGFATGDTNTDNLLTPGETWTYTATYEIVQADINAGGFYNSATAEGTPPSGPPVSDQSDNGDDTDGNTTDDSTVVEIAVDPVLDVEKVVTTSAAAVGDTVVFEIRAANRGNVDLIDVTVSDTLSRSDGTDLSGLTTGPTRIANPDDNGDATLAPGEVWSWEVSYTVTQEDIDAGGLSNVAIASGTETDGTPIEDTADDGDDTDGNITDDPTEVAFPPAPGLEATKEVVSVGEFAGEEAVFTILVENTGNVTLSDLTLAEDMTNGEGTALDGYDVVLSGLTGGVLPPGEVATFTVTYVLTQDDIDSGSLINSATVTGTTPGGDDVSDKSDNGDDTDGNTTDDPTVAEIEQNPAVEVTKEAEIPVRIGANLYEVVFNMTVANTGNVSLTDLEVEDDLGPFLAPATLSGVDVPVVGGFDIGTANAAYDGLVDIRLIEDGGKLVPGSTGTIELTVRYDTSAGFPASPNTLSVGSALLSERATATALVPAGDEPNVLASKTASPGTARLGDTITYSLRFENLLDTAEADVVIIDDLPDGIVYTPNTAVVDGGALEPSVTGNVLRWGTFSLGAGEVIEVRYRARLVGGEVGDYTNTTYALGADGIQISNVAEATVRREPEAVFDCADIIGKVFDDRNLNGYQDGLIDDPRAVNLSELQRFATDPVLSPDGEPGIPNVRVATPNGLLITTDEFGRFSVPCGSLPSSIGSNFMLKLDTRTLPTGYFVTTENPRVIRVTPGRMARLNFGATLGNVVELDLMASTFDPNGAEPNAALAGYVDQIVAQIAGTPSMVRLTYYRAGESQSVANARVDALERLIRDRWKGVGRYRLIVERNVFRIEQ